MLRFPIRSTLLLSLALSLSARADGKCVSLYVSGPARTEMAKAVTQAKGNGYPYIAGVIGWLTAPTGKYDPPEIEAAINEAKANSLEALAAFFDAIKANVESGQAPCIDEALITNAAAAAGAVEDGKLSDAEFALKELATEAR